MYKLFLITAMVICQNAIVAGQDRKVRVSMHQCEHLFVKNNLLLLASQFNIDAQKAQVIQSKLWENPYLGGEINAIDPENYKFFHLGPGGQTAIALQQLIYLGNKKKNEVQLARTNQHIAELEYEDLLRSLRYELRNSFFNIYYDNLTLGILDFQIKNLDTLIDAYSSQSQKGNVPLRDVVRLQSLYLTLRNNRTELAQSIIQEQQKLSLITGTDSLIYSDPTEIELKTYNQVLELPVDSLQQRALKFRPDLLITEETILASQWNLKWQKSLVVPDMSVGAAYDQNGGAFTNQLGLTLGFPLVLWNRNQGNIQIAFDQLNTSQALNNQKVLEVKSEVISAYYRYLDAFKNASLINTGTFVNFQTVYNGVFENFQKRNISLLEFTDFMESYNVSINQSYQFMKTLSSVSEELNYVTGSNIF